MEFWCCNRSTEHYLNRRSDPTLVDRIIVDDNSKLASITIMDSRNIGEFVSRTKYIIPSGNKPIFIHAILNNSIGFLSLIGLFLLMANFQNISSGGMPWFITGVVFISSGL